MKEVYPTMPAPKRVKECYFYKDDNKYHVRLKDSKNNFIKETLVYESRADVHTFVTDLREGNLSKYCCSALGTMIYNKKPQDRRLVVDSKLVFNAFVKNLTKLSENNSFYKQKVASILNDVSALLTYDLEDGSLEPHQCTEPQDSIDTIIPAPAIDPGIPMHVIAMFEDQLETAMNLEDLTFYFQKEKFQLTKAVYDSEVPAPDLPKTAPTILSALDFMITLLGVNADRNKTIGENGFTFAMDEEIYKVKHIYTGSGITIARDDE